MVVRMRMSLLHVGVTLLLKLLLHPVPVLLLLWVRLGFQVDPAGLLRGSDRGRRRDHHLLIAGRRHRDRGCDGSQVGQVHDLMVL